MSDEVEAIRGRKHCFSVQAEKDIETLLGKLQEREKEIQGWIARSAENSSRLSEALKDRDTSEQCLHALQEKFGAQSHEQSKDLDTLHAVIDRLEAENAMLLADSNECRSRLDAVLKLAKDGTPDAETRGDEDGHYAQGQIDLGKAIKAILVERHDPNIERTNEGEAIVTHEDGSRTTVKLLAD